MSDAEGMEFLVGPDHLCIQPGVSPRTARRRTGANRLAKSAIQAGLKMSLSQPLAQAVRAAEFLRK